MSFVKSKWFIFSVVLAVIIAVGTVLYLQNKNVETVVEEDESDLLPPVQIKILNGCGIPGAANLIADALYYENIVVTSTGNANSFNYNKSIIIVKKDIPEDLKRLRKMTTIDEYTLAVTERTTAPFYVIVGKDYEQVIKRIRSKEKSKK